MKLSQQRAFLRVKLILNISLAILSVVIFLGLLELYTRYKYARRDGDKGFHTRGYHQRYTPKKQTPHRIVCVGGSTTYGDGVEHNETYPFYLEQIINKKIGKNFAQVINSGLGAKATEHHRDFIKERIDDQELDIIVLHSLYNHFVAFYEPDDPTIEKIIVDPGLLFTVRPIYRWDKMNLAEKLNVFLLEHSYFYQKLRREILRMREEYLNRHYGTKQEYKPEALKTETEIYGINPEEDIKELMTSYLNRYYEAIEDIILTAKSRNVDVVLVILPYPFYGERRGKPATAFKPPHYSRVVFKKAKQCLVKLGQKYNLLVVDADDTFYKRGREASLFFIDGVHLTPKGNYMLARLIAQELIPELEKKELIVAK